MLKKVLLLMGSILGGGIIFSCNKTEDSAPRFNLDKVSVEIISTGQMASGELPVVSVLASEGYSSSSDSPWLSVDKPQGSGKTDVTILAERYESGSGRTGHITFTSGCESYTVTVRQTASPFPAFGYLYFEDDFSWITPYATALGAGDFIATADPNAKAPNVGSESEKGNADAAAFMEEFAERGFSVMKPEDNTFYLMAHYFKFGRTDHNNGLILPSFDLASTGEKTTDIELSFDFSGHLSTSLYVDKIQMVVEVLSGGGEILKSTGAYARISDPFTPDQKDGEAKWTGASVKIKGITPDTVLAIRHANMDEKGTYRFHLDNIKAVKVPVK